MLETFLSPHIANGSHWPSILKWMCHSFFQLLRDELWGNSYDISFVFTGVSAIHRSLLQVSHELEHKNSGLFDSLSITHSNIVLQWCVFRNLRYVACISQWVLSDSAQMLGLWSHWASICGREWETTYISRKTSLAIHKHFLWAYYMICSQFWKN